MFKKNISGPGLFFCKLKPGKQNSWLPNCFNLSLKAGSRLFRLFSLFLLLLNSVSLFGQTITSNATGNWNVGGTWVGGVVPGATDDVIISSGHTVTLVAAFTSTGSITVTGTLQLAGFSITSGDLQGAGIITSSGGTPVLTTGNNNSSTTFSGVIGTGAIALTKNGSGALTLSGNNTYTGATTIAAGTLKLGNTNALGTTAGATSVTSGAVLDLNGITYSNTEILTLNGTGISTGGALINSNATAATYAGNIALGTAPQVTADNPITLSGVISGTSDLRTAGTSTLTLSGTNTNTGLNTLLTGSTLKLANAAALGSAASRDYTIVSNGAVLDLNGTNYTSLEFLRLGSSSGGGGLINSSATTATFAGKIDIYNFAFTVTADNPIIISGQIASSGPGYIKAGASTFTVTSANNTWGYPITVNAGTLITGNTNALGSSTSNAVTVNSGGALDLNGFSNASVRPLTLNGTGISGGGSLINNSATAATFSSNITLGSTSSIVGGTGTIAITGTVTGATFGLTLGGAAGGSVTGIISGAGTSLTKSDAGVWTVSGNNTYTGATTVNAGYLRAGTNNVTTSAAGAFGNNASELILNGGTIQSNVATFSRPITVTATNSGIDAYGSARTISSTINNATVSTSYNLNIGGTTNGVLEGQNLTLSGVITNTPGTLSITKIGTNTASFTNQAVTIQDLSINAGTLTSTSATLSVAGNFSNYGTFTHNSGTVTFNGSSLQGIGAATFNNLTINNAAGVTLWWDVTHSGILTLSSGVITTAAYTLTAPATATVSRTSGHVFGNFQKNMPIGATSKTFEIGDASNYTPVAVTFANITTAGNLKASTSSGDHTFIGTSTFAAGKTANRSWTLTNSGIVFASNYSATFTFVAGDLDALATPSNFIVGRYSSGWTYPTVGTKTSISTQATGLSAFGDFQVGEVSVTKTFTGTGNFSDATKWTSGTLPGAGNDLIIDGACTVDNNAGTDNIAYGTLTIGTATGRTLDWAASGTNRLNVSNVSAGAGASTLNMTNGGTLITRGSLTSTNLTFTPGTGTMELQSTLALPAAYTTYNNLIVNSTGATVSLAAATTITGSLTITTGTLNANNFNISLKGNWTNNVSTTAFTAGTATVTFSGTIPQAIAGTFVTTFNNLTILNTGSTVTLSANASINGNLSISTGTFDIGAFTANRAIAGGTLTVSNNATLKIGGTNNYPLNYNTNTLVVASTVEYAGVDQTVSNQLYGNLKLSSAAGAAVKTFPATALSVVGNLSSTLGSGTSVSFTAASIITVTGSVSIGASTTFNGASYAHGIGGNWVNNGTFNGNTGTITFTGSGSAVSGAGVQNFNNLTVAASSVSFSNNSINLTGNLATTGSGSFSQSSGGTLYMTGAAKTVGGAGISLDNLSVSGSVTSSVSLTLTGNLAVSGSFTSSGVTITMSGASKTISGAGTIGFGALYVTGSVTTDVNFSISSGLTVNGSLSSSAGTVSFTGTATLSGTANLFNTTINGTSLQLSAGSVLGIANIFTITSGSFDVTTSAPNTVNFNGTGAQNINAITYSNLILSNGNTKTAVGAFTTLYDITIGTGTTFDLVSYTCSVYGNWTNNGTFTAGTSTLQFLGSAPANISGVTTFNVLTSNTALATTQLILQSNITAAIVNMTNGMILTGSNTLTITNTRTGNGIILGNIQRTHAFITGVAYAFEGPDNTINFSSVSSVSSVTISVAKGSIIDFPFGGSISRVYDITIPSGTYTATLRLHYEDNELNGNVESSMGLWRYNGSSWGAIGTTANNTTSNYAEQSGLTNITNRWTCSDNSNVAQWTGSVSSDWNTAANWAVSQGSPTTPPSATDIVNLGTAAFTNQPTISNTVSVKNINFGSAQAVTLSMAAGGTLTSGGINGNWSSNVTHTINTNNQTININSDLSLSDGVNGHAINLNIGAGTVNVDGTVIQSGGANIVFSAAGSLNITKDHNYVSGTFTPGTGTVTYNGLDDQSVGAVNYNNLVINKATAIATINNPLTIGGNLTVTAGELGNHANTVISGNVAISSGATLQNFSVLHVGGNWINNGTFTATGASIFFDGSGTQTISASTFNNLNINKPLGSIAELSGNTVIKGDLSIVSGTLNIKTFNCNRGTQGGNLLVSGPGTLIIGANNPPINFSNVSLASTSTVIFDGTGAQSISSAGSFGHLILRNAGTKTPAASITVNGNLTIESGATFNGSSNTITLNGNWVNAGSFTPSTGTVIFSGNAKSITGITTFNNVTVSGIDTILNNVTVNGLLNITSTGNLRGGGAVLVTMNGDLINSGILFHTGTTTFTGNVLQTLSLINAVQTVALIVNFNGSVSPVLNSTSTPQFGYLNINNTGGLSPSVGWTILYSLTVGSGASFNGGNSTHNILGAVTNNGTITSSGNLNFIPSSSVTVNAGSNFSSTGTVLFGGAGAMTLAGTPLSFYDVVIANTNIVGITPTSAWNIGNNFTIMNGSTLTAGNYGTIATNNVSILTGAVLTINGGTLQIAGTINNSGIFNASNGTVEMNGASPQTIPANAFTNNRILNLIINNDVTLAGQDTLTGTLTVGGSGITFSTGGFLNLKSTAAATARVAPLPVDGTGAATSFITGDVTIERYIPNKRAWRLLTSPLSATGSIYDNWQNAGVYQAGKGMFITGPNPGIITGLDASPRNSISLKSYDPVTQRFLNITNTKTGNLSNSTGSADNIGYFAFVRGDRNPNNFNAGYSNSTTLRSTGKLQTGKQVFAASASYNSYTLMGNPFASPVDFNNVQRTHLIKRFYTWDATTNGVGAYVILDDLDGDGIFSSSDPGSLQNNHIQSSQAFFVQTDTAGAASLIFNESSKSILRSNAGFRPQGQVVSMGITLNLVEGNNSIIKADAVMAEFNETFSAGVNLQDAIKFTNVNETLSLLREGTSLAIERRPLINSKDTLFLKLVQSVRRNYQFVVQPTGLDQPSLLAFLEDKYLSAKTPINLTGSTTINFTINADAVSSRSDRFSVVFIQGSPLPVIYRDVKASRQGKNIAVQWQVDNQLNIRSYDVEKSTDGNHFYKVNTQLATGNNGSAATYHWLDLHAVEGENFYRIRNADLDGTTAYSKVVKVNMRTGAAEITVYPNPVTGGNIGLQLINMSPGKYLVRLSDQTGKEILTKEINHPGGTFPQNIQVNKYIAKGLYNLEITHPDNNKTNIGVVNQ